jgi:hypothetical protein
MMKPSATPPLSLTRDEGLTQRERGRADRHRVRRGVYTDAAAWQKLRPWERYRLRVEAVGLTWDAPVFCLESAAVHLGLPVYGEPHDIHLLDPDGKSRRFGDVVVHSTKDELELVTSDGVTTTALTETALGLVRVLPPAFGLGVADRALRMLSSHGEAIDFAALAGERCDRRGLRRIEWVNARARVHAESVGESVSRAVIEWLGFDEPELQVVFAAEGPTDRVDFFWRRMQIIGESDGYGKYDATDAEAAKAHFVSEKIREDRLRRQVDGFARWDWGDAMRADRLDAKLRAAGLIPNRPRNATLLATLSANARSLAPTGRHPKPG